MTDRFDERAREYYGDQPKALLDAHAAWGRRIHNEALEAAFNEANYFAQHSVSARSIAEAILKLKVTEAG